METPFATKITQNAFCYHMVGTGRNILYDKRNRSVILSDANTGAPLKIIEKDEDLEFEDFVLVAQNIQMDMVDFSS